MEGAAIGTGSALLNVRVRGEQDEKRTLSTKEDFDFEASAKTFDLNGDKEAWSKTNWSEEGASETNPEAAAAAASAAAAACNGCEWHRVEE